VQLACDGVGQSAVAFISCPASQKFDVDICEAHVATAYIFFAVAPWERRMTMMQFESSFILVYWSSQD
jgi:hypothetical protein